MKALILSAFLTTLSALGLSAQAIPDFSGTWTMDLSRSEAAAQGTEIGPVTLAIRQSPNELRVETTRNGSTEVISYFPVGSKTAPTGQPTGTFRWDGPRLVTDLVTHINNQAVTIEETRSLNQAATEMVVVVNLVVQHGYQTGGTGVARSANAPNTSIGRNVYVKAK